MKKVMMTAAALLATTMTASAGLTETIVLQNDYETNNTEFVADSRVNVTTEANKEAGSKVLRFHTHDNALNAYALASLHFGSKTAGAEKVKIDFDFYFNEVNPNYSQYITIRDGNAVPEFGKSKYSDTGAFFYLGECRSGQGVNYWSINGDYTSMDTEVYFNKWLHATVIIDLKRSTVDYTVKTKNGIIVLNSAKEIPFANKRAVNCSQIDFYAGANSTDAFIDNLVITKYSDPTAVLTSYNVTFKDDQGKILKPKKVYYCNVGETFKANDLDMNDFTNKEGTEKYTYTTGNVPTVAQRSGRDNNLNLVFKTHRQVNYTIKAVKDDQTLATIASGKAFLDGTQVASWKKYIKVNGMWYETVAPYAKHITDAVSEVQYKDAHIDYFFECEDLTMTHAPAATTISPYNSGLQAPRHYGDIDSQGKETTSQWITPPLERGGNFILKIPYTRSAKTNSTINVFTRSPKGEMKDTGIALTSTGQEGLFKVDIIVPEGHSIVLYNKAPRNSNIYMDYITLQRR